MTERTHRGKHSGNSGLGHHWIRDAKRRKIYERDSWHCLWCRVLVGEFRANAWHPTASASLDHFLPRSKGGSNLSTNVFTSCQDCNSRRGDMSALEFAHKAVGVGAAALLERLLRAIDNPVESPATLRKAAK